MAAREYEGTASAAPISVGCFDSCRGLLLSCCPCCCPCRPCCRPCSSLHLPSCPCPYGCPCRDPATPDDLDLRAHGDDRRPAPACPVEDPTEAGLDPPGWPDSKARPAAVLGVLADLQRVCLHLGVTDLELATCSEREARLCRPCHLHLCRLLPSRAARRLVGRLPMEWQNHGLVLETLHTVPCATLPELAEADLLLGSLEHPIPLEEVDDVLDSVLVIGWLVDRSRPRKKYCDS